MSSLTLVSATPRAPALSAPREWIARHRRDLPLLTALALFVIIVLFGAALAPFDPLKPDMKARLQPPGAIHLMGTDPLGRDIFSRVLAGAQLSIRSVVVIIISAVGIGMMVGALAGYAGGLVDDVIMRITDLFLAFPALVLALAIAGALGPSLTNAMLAVSVVWWPWYARLVRGQVLSIKAEPYVEAARAIGASDPRIVRRHIVPNFLSPVIVQATLDIGAALVITASLSFIGMGAQPPSPEWGAMLSDGRSFFLNAWWLSAFPGLAIFLTVLLCNAAGRRLHLSLPG
ncbi:MAG: nickel transporter permease [Thermomicrobiales bacterium]